MEEQQKAISHPEMVRVLAKSGANILAGLNPHKCHLFHMAIGMATEVGGEMLPAMARYIEGSNQTDWENVLEEFGDFEFYFRGACQGIGLEDDHVFNFDHDFRPGSIRMMGEHLTELVIETANFLDLAAKKEAVYGKQVLSDEYYNSLKKIRYHLSYLYAGLSQHGITFEAALAANINKLGDRYKNFQYTDQAAIARADKAESGETTHS